MDKTIHKHLDRRLDIQEEAVKMLDEVLESIDLKSVLKNPEAELARVAHIALGVAEAHARDAVDEGERFAKEVKEKGPVKVQNSDDPKLNKEEAIS